MSESEQSYTLTCVASMTVKAQDALSSMQQTVLTEMQNCKKITIDGSEVKEIDSIGLQWIIALYRSAEIQQIQIEMKEMSPVLNDQARDIGLQFLFE